MALLETAASDPEAGNEMSSIWLNQWQKHNFLSFKEAGEQIIGHFNIRGHMIHFVNHWGKGRDGTRIWSLTERSHRFNLATSEEKNKLPKDALKAET